MILGGASFCIGAILCAFAQDLAMLIIGRVCLGAGVGFANQAVPLYLSEIAPAHARGTLNIMFQMATTIGIWVAEVRIFCLYLYLLYFLLLALLLLVTLLVPLTMWILLQSTDNCWLVITLLVINLALPFYPRFP